MTFDMHFSKRQALTLDLCSGFSRAPGFKLSWGQVRLLLGVSLWLLSPNVLFAQSTVSQPSAGTANTTANPPVSADSKLPERGISEWLVRMHEGSRKRTYVGTFVVSSSSSMSSSRIWHVCDGEQQMERVEALTGAPRSTIRRNDEVVTFLADSKTAISEKRESLGVFPNLLKTNQPGLEQFYSARQGGVDRVAGFETDVVLLQPKDALRFGYRVWSEKKSGLVVKLQTLDVDGRVLEQAAYSELHFDAPVSMGKLTQLMTRLEGYKVVRPDQIKTTALSEGWILKNPVAGFKPVSCFKRNTAKADATAPGSESSMQWIFSDGLASVSLFVENFDRLKHLQEGQNATGATHSLTRRLVERPGDKSADKSGDKVGDWWLTVLGEVPLQTLASFAQGLERKK